MKVVISEFSCLKELSCLQCMVQALVVHHGSLVDHADSVIVE
jgi:hypothetical protein